jgi:hypothetical protein
MPRIAEIFREQFDNGKDWLPNPKQWSAEFDFPFTLVGVCRTCGDTIYIKQPVFPRPEAPK